MKKTIALLLATSGLVQAGYVWKGDDYITTFKWNQEANWTLTDGTTWNSTSEVGPGVTNSNMWDKITVESASGSITQLEGWNLDLTLVNTQLSVSRLIKLQNEGGKSCSINIDKNSSLTITQYSGGNDGQPVYLNCEGFFSWALDKNQGGGGTYADLGATGMVKFLKHRLNTETDGFTAKIMQLEADLLDDVSFTLGQVTDRVLVELTKGTTLNTLAYDDVKINASDEWIRVGSADEVVNDGNKYYWVTQNEGGVKLSYVATAAPIPEPTTATLSLLALAGLAARRRRR